MDTPTSPSSVSSGERQIIEWEFKRQLGAALISYSRIETFLFGWFERIAEMTHSDIARRIFYSQSGTYAMIQMFRAALDPLSMAPDAKPFLVAATNKLRKYSETRNLMVHGEAVFVDDPSSPYHATMMIVPGRDLIIKSIAEGDYLTTDRLNNAEDNFRNLALALLATLNWDGKSPEKSPDTLLQLVRLLPTVAHSTRLPPNAVRPFLPVGQEFALLR